MVVEKCAAEPKKDVFVYDYYYSEVGTIDDTYLDQLLRWDNSRSQSNILNNLLFFC